MRPPFPVVLAWRNAPIRIALPWSEVKAYSEEIGPGRGPERGRPALDEVETLRGDRERFEVLIAVMNVGFERGERRGRCYLKEVPQHVSATVMKSELKVLAERPSFASTRARRSWT